MFFKANEEWSYNTLLKSFQFWEFLSLYCDKVRFKSYYYYCYHRYSNSNSTLLNSIF